MEGKAYMILRLMSEMFVISCNLFMAFSLYIFGYSAWFVDATHPARFFAVVGIWCVAVMTVTGILHLRGLCEARAKQLSAEQGFKG